MDSRILYCLLFTVGMVLSVGEYDFCPLKSENLEGSGTCAQAHKEKNCIDKGVAVGSEKTIEVRNEGWFFNTQLYKSFSIRADCEVIVSFVEGWFSDATTKHLSSNTSSNFDSGSYLFCHCNLNTIPENASTIANEGTSSPGSTTIASSGSSTTLPSSSG